MIKKNQKNMKEYDKRKSHKSSRLHVIYNCGRKNIYVKTKNYELFGMLNYECISTLSDK